MDAAPADPFQNGTRILVIASQLLPSMNRESREAKRILYVDNRTEYVVSHRLPLLAAVRERGFEVHVTTLTAGDSAAIERAGFPYHQIASGGRSNNPLRELGLIVRLSRLYRGLKPDLVHPITLRSILYGEIAATFADVPVAVNGVTGLGYLFSASSFPVRLARRAVLGLIRGLTGRRDRYYIFQNPDDEALFQEHGITDSASGFVIKGSGVNVERFEYTREPKDTPIALFPARMLWHKGVREFVEAARILKKGDLEARFVLVGDTDADNPAAVPANQLKRWESEGAIEWWGYRDDMPEVFAQVHVICLPSSYREGVPKVLIEAASSGRPIVTTDMPGCREIVRDGENGYLVPPRDSEAVARALKRLLRRSALREQMGRSGRDLVRNEFSIGHVVDSTLQLYRKVLLPSHATTLEPAEYAAAGD